MDKRDRARGKEAILRWTLTALPCVVAWCVSSCRKEPPPAPKKPAFDLEQATSRLVGLGADDAFFRELEALKAEASKPGADPSVLDAAVRFDLCTLAAGLSFGAEWLTRVTGGGPGDAARIAGFLKGVADRVAGRDAALAADLRAMAGAFDPSAVADLSGVLARAEKDDPLAPSLRLLAARRLLDALAAAVAAPDFERGPLLMQALPGWPNPITSDPMQTAFPRALERLARWLALGEGQEKGLGPSFAKVREQANSLLQGRVFPMPVAPVAEPRPSTPVTGLAGTYTPLVVVALKGEEMRVGLRPALAWEDGQVRDLAKDQRFPGAPVASGADLTRLTDALVEVGGARLREAIEAAAPIEARAYPEAGEARNADRKDRPRTLLWTVEQGVPAQRFETALALAERAGLGEARLLQPGSLFQVLPFFFRQVPAIAGLQAPKGARVLVALGADAAEIYPPAAGGRCGVPGGTWPEGVRVLRQGGEVTGVQVRWGEAEGFKGLLAAALGRWFQEARSGCALAPLVPVIVRARDLPSAMLADAVAEVLAAPGPAFTDVSQWFPGLACREGGPCPAAIPILFAADRVPKPTKTEAKVEVSRPAGFCDQKDVARVMGGRAGAVRACYEMYLQRNPELAGRLEVRFTIEEDGSISGLTVTANELGQEVAACVLRQIASLKFPKPAGGVCVIRWPYRFKPGG